MIIEITRKFKKQVEACKDTSIRAQVGKTLEDTIAASKPSDIKHLKKLKGAKNCFRIKLDNYRIGLKIQNDVIIFAAFDHRADIYKYFP